MCKESSVCTCEDSKEKRELEKADCVVCSSHEVAPRNQACSKIYVCVVGGGPQKGYF